MSFSSLPVRVRNALASANINTPEELAQKSRSDLHKTKNVGSKTIAVLEAFLAARNLTLRPEHTIATGGPAPEWLLTYEQRAKDAGFKTERHPRHGGTMWLSVVPGTDWGSTILFFGRNDFILVARVQNQHPHELIAAASVLADAIAIIEPESSEKKLVARAEAA